MQSATVEKPTLSLAELRAKLDAAIGAEAWEAVKIIHERIQEAERAGVIDFAVESKKREHKK